MLCGILVGLCLSKSFFNCSQQIGVGFKGFELWKLLLNSNRRPKENADIGFREHRCVIEGITSGNDVVLFIDEAQDLDTDLLEQVRLLSNLETDQTKLLQIVLLGQPELRDKLAQNSLRQLRQRITVRYHLSPLSREETEAYIQHRLRVAGADSRPVFTPWAVRKIFSYSRGVPRLINAVCDKTLLCGFVTGNDELTAAHVRRAIRELEGTFS